MTTWRQAIGLTALWLVCFATDTFFHSGYQSMTRGEAIEARAGQIAARANALDRVRLAEASALAVAMPARPREIVAADLEGAKLAAGSCGAARAHVDACIKLAALRVEWSGIEARERVVSTLETARADLAKLPEIELYPEFKNVRANLKSLGFEVSGAALAGIMSLLFLVIFDGLPVAALGAAMQPLPAKPAKPAKASKPNGAASEVALALEAARQGVATPGVTRQKDGAYRIVQGRLATGLGLDQPTVRAQLIAIDAAGRAAVEFGSHGTIVRGF